MAQTGSAVTVDLHQQILYNCRFMLGEDVAVSIVTAKEQASDKIRAMAVRTEGCGRSAKRSVLFSDQGPTLADALDRLHGRSAEALGQHILTHGFDPVRTSPPGARRHHHHRRGRGRCGSWSGSDRDALSDSESLDGSEAEQSIVQSSSSSSSSDEKDVRHHHHGNLPYRPEKTKKREACRADHAAAHDHRRSKREPEPEPR